MKRHRLIAVLLLLLANGVWAVGESPDSDFRQRMEAGQALYNHGKHDQAIKEFKEAVRLQPNSSVAHLWLGRALGRKAEKSNPLRAAFMVGDIRRAFERAVQLDPGNLEARSDLLDFYLDAPSAFGGSIEKARAQAEAIARLNKAEGHSARARIAEKEKRYNVAEREYRAAMQADPAHAGYRRDLEKFLRKHKPGETPEALEKQGVRSQKSEVRSDSGPAVHSDSARSQKPEVRSQK